MIPNQIKQVASSEGSLNATLFFLCNQCKSLAHDLNGNSNALNGI